jgi:hypothetical protein
MRNICESYFDPNIREWQKLYGVQEYIILIQDKSPVSKLISESALRNFAEFLQYFVCNDNVKSIWEVFL